MAIRYYLIPFETDAVKLAGMSAAPKYLDLMNSIAVAPDLPKGLISSKVKNAFVRNYYIIKLGSNDFTALDAQLDVIHLTKQKILNNLDKVKALGIDTTGFTADTTLSQIQKRICKWLIDDDTRDFSRI